MQKIKNVKEFVEKLDAAKKVNPKDLSSDQDLSIGIMNLISIEEHLMFSGAKTGKTAFYDQINQVREMRKRMMQKIIPSYEGEVWCISKHLLASSMRLFEVGTKALAAGILGGASELKYVPKEKKVAAKTVAPVGADTPAPTSMGRLKNWVKNAVNCCIE